MVPQDEFKSRVDRLATQVHQSDLADNVEAVYMPGEIEFKTKERRLIDGIPIPKAVVVNLDQIAEELNIPQKLR